MINTCRNAFYEIDSRLKPSQPQNERENDGSTNFRSEIQNTLKE